MHSNHISYIECTKLLYGALMWGLEFDQLELFYDL